MTINDWGSDDPAEVAKGGTGAATHTSGGILLGAGTSAITSTSALTTGQTIIGSTGVSPVPAAISGTASQINVDGTTPGSITLRFTSPSVVLGGTSATTIPIGTTAQESSPTNGMIRYDSDTEKLRGVVGGVWVDLIGSGGTAGKWNLLATASNTPLLTEVAFTSSVISQFDCLMFAYTGMAKTGGADENMLIQVSNDNGSSYETTGYLSDGFEGTTGTTGATPVTTGVPMGTIVANQSTGYFYIGDPLVSTSKTSISAYCFNGSTITSGTQFWGGIYDTAEANDAFRIVRTGGGQFIFVFYALWGLQTA